MILPYTFIQMGNLPVSYYRSNQYYRESGNIHVEEFGEMMNSDQNWPTSPTPEDKTESGRWFCDKNGIPRDGNWCKVGHFSARFPLLYNDVYRYYLKKGEN